MRQLKMAVAAAVIAAAAWPLSARGADDEQQDNDKTKVEKELKELEQQRSKIDSKIQELRKKSGKGELRAYKFSVNGDKPIIIDGSNGEHKIIIEKAMEEAHRALGEAFKNMPNIKQFKFDGEGKGETFIMPDVENIIRKVVPSDGKSEIRVFSDIKSGKSNGQKEEIEITIENGEVKARRNGKPLSKEEAEKLHIEMSQKHNLVAPKAPKALELRGLGSGNFTAPRVLGADPTLRDEIRRLREELNQLREELRSKKGPESTKVQSFLNGYDL